LEGLILRQNAMRRRQDHEGNKHNSFFHHQHSVKTKMVRIGLEITHTCDKCCPRCNHRVATSPYKHMTMEQYQTVAQAMVGLNIREVLLIGGEPLMHPQFSQLLRQVHDDFPRADLLLSTNGSRLHLLNNDDRCLFKRITLSFYGKFNQDVVRKIIEVPSQYPNVFFADSRKLDDPNIDPRLDEEKARHCHIMCRQRCVRIIGTRVYGCCIAEALERHYGTEKVHMELRPGWHEVFKSLPTYKVCQRCYVAAQLQQSSIVRCKARVTFKLRNSLAGMVYRLVKRSVTRRKLRQCIGIANGV
jgi:hypothetical protein